MTEQNDMVQSLQSRAEEKSLHRLNSSECHLNSCSAEFTHDPHAPLSTASSVEDLHTSAIWIQFPLPSACLYPSVRTSEPHLLQVSASFLFMISVSDLSNELHGVLDFQQRVQILDGRSISPNHEVISAHQQPPVHLVTEKDGTTFDAPTGLQSYIVLRWSSTLQSHGPQCGLPLGRSVKTHL